MHEIVFGEKPRWSDGGVAGDAAAGARAEADGGGAGGARRVPRVHGEGSGAADRERGRGGADADRARGRWRARRSRRSRRPLVWAAALTSLAAVAASGWCARGRDGPGRTRERRAQSPRESPLIVPTGEPADWTDISTVLAEVPERISCTRLLPDQAHDPLRLGHAAARGGHRHGRRASASRRRSSRRPTPRAARTCRPTASASSIQGHATDGRAFAFLSERPDGDDAVPVVPTAEPTMSSEPTWLGDGQTFSYDVDTKHIGVFSTALRRVHDRAGRDVAALRHVVQDVDARRRAGVRRLRRRRDGGRRASSCPGCKRAERFRVGEPLLDIRPDGELLYAVGRVNGSLTDLLELDPRAAAGADWAGFAGKSCAARCFSTTWLSFVSTRFNHKLSCATA